MYTNDSPKNLKLVKPPSQATVVETNTPSAASYRAATNSRDSKAFGIDATLGLEPLTSFNSLNFSVKDLL